MVRLVAGLFAGAVAVFSLPAVDATRTARNIDQALLFVPETTHLRAAAFGFDEPLADLLWVRAILTFGERYGTEGGGWLTWLGRMIEAVCTLDPGWRTPYFYGGSMLRASGDIAASDLIFEAGRANLPDDPYFPFSLGMNAYLYRQDHAAAAAFLEEAAACPDAPFWYASAAAAMHQDAGDRGVGIRYLREVRDSTQDPNIRADAERQLGRLMHNELVDLWAPACRARKAERGPLPAPEDLRELGFDLPENPRGDAWIVGSDGVVRSEGAEDERVRDLRLAELRLIGG
jgi:hypothetical protein